MRLSVFRSSPPEVCSQKDTRQTRSKLAGKQLRRSAISRKLPKNFIEIKPLHGCASKNLQHTYRTPISRRIPLGHCFCMSKEF